MPKADKHRGSRLDDLLREDGLYDERRPIMSPNLAFCDTFS